MVERSFEVTTNPARRLISVRFKPSFWDEVTLRSFVQACQVAVSAFEAGTGHHVILVDLRDAVIQSQETIKRMQSLLGSAPARKIALVADTPLARMQTKRLQVRDTIVMFKTTNDAEAWLFLA